MASVERESNGPPLRRSYPLHVVPREGAEEAGALRRADVPAVVALLHDEHHVTLQKLELVVVLGPVVVERAVPGRREGGRHARSVRQEGLANDTLSTAAMVATYGTGSECVSTWRVCVSGCCGLACGKSEKAGGESG